VTDAQAPTKDAPTLAPAQAQELDELVRSRSADLGVPGVAVGLVCGGQEHVFTAGVTSSEAPLDVDADTLFMVGSTTKTVTATALLGLVEQGRLDLDTPIRSYLPTFTLSDPAVAASLTLRHLLTHSGGFEGDVPDDEDWGEDALARSIGGYGSLAQYSAPGSTFSYSNAGLRLAGRVLEVVTERTYETAVRELVLEPLGMSQSFYFPWHVYSRRHSVGHVVDESGATVAHTWGMGRSAAPEGGLVSTVRDQLRYARFHVDGSSLGAPPLSDAMRREMQRQQLGAAPPFDAVGLPWLLVDTHGVRAVTHGGNIAGVQLSSLLMLPDLGFAVTVLTNAAPGRELGSEVTDWCLENLLGLPRDTAVGAHTLPDDQLPQYAGRYNSGIWGMDLEPQDGGLLASFSFNEQPDDEVAVLPPPLRLEFARTDEVVLAAKPDDVFGRFERDGAGTVVRLLCQGRATHRVVPDLESV
jgi:CubicO group peptidase (beta-lactamase class C family)